MKKLLLSACFVAVALCAAAQGTTNPGQTELPERNLKLMVRNPKGKVVRDIELVAQLKGSREALRLDRFGNRFFRVTDADTLLLMVPGNIYEFPLEGFDSLYVVFRGKSKIAGYVPKSGKADLVNIGYGTVPRRSNTSSVSTLDMKGAYAYNDLKSYIQGRVAGVTFDNSGRLLIRGISSINSGIEALIVVDGIVMPSFSAANGTISPHDVASISVLKDAGSTSIYGVRGANGVVVITTKSGAREE